MSYMIQIYLKHPFMVGRSLGNIAQDAGQLPHQYAQRNPINEGQVQLPGHYYK